MVDRDLPLYENVPEVWDEDQCDKKARRYERDALGTPYPFRGYIGSDYGPIRYNGGIVRDGKWWQGETRPLPTIPKNFEIIHLTTWGYRIRKKIVSPGTL